MDIISYLYTMFDDESAIDILIEAEVLTIPTCPNCFSLMRRTPQTPHLYRCRRRNEGFLCDVKHSIFNSTIFQNKKTSLFEIMYIMDCWRKNVFFEIVSYDLGCSISTVNRWYEIFNKVILWKSQFEAPYMIGGDGIYVEVDETLLVKRKYHRGRILRNQVWVLKGVVRGSCNEYFIEVVSHRNRETLLEVIQRRIRYGSIIITDKWRGYLHLEILLNFRQYLHFVVDHSRNFVDPISGAHTQTIEAMFSVMKRKLRRKGTKLGSINKIIDNYHVDRFVMNNRENLMFNMLSYIKEYELYN